MDTNLLLKDDVVKRAQELRDQALVLRDFADKLDKLAKEFDRLWDSLTAHFPSSREPDPSDLYHERLENNL